jgi:predicted ArsR family transcriptional regulator
VFRIDQAHAAFGGEEFEASQLADLCEVEVRTANRWLKAWVRQGYVDRTQQAAGSTAAKYRITDAAAALVMPGRAA